MSEVLPFDLGYRILRWWAPSIGNRTDPSTHPDVDTYLAAYPDLIALSCILAEARCQLWTFPAATPGRSRAIGTVYAAAIARFPDHRRRTGPLDQWVHDQLLVIAHWRRAGQHMAVLTS